MALNAAFRECGLRLGIDCLRFCFPPRAVNHRSAVVGARKVPREAEVIIPGCMCPPIPWTANRTRQEETPLTTRHRRRYPCYRAIGRQIGLQSWSSGGRPATVQSKCKDSAQGRPSIHFNEAPNNNMSYSYIGQPPKKDNVSVFCSYI